MLSGGQLVGGNSTSKREENDFYATNPETLKMSLDKLKVFEAFSGYGSQSIALRNLGIPHEVVAISEIDKYAIKAYYALHDKNIPNLGDISKIKVEDIPQHDLFTYSFPCQDLSVAGKTRGLIRGETRSGLLYECERIIEYCKPKYLLMENVKNLVSKKFKPQFDEWLNYLESLGYTNYWQVLNAKNYGVPQNRERVFVVSILGPHETYEFPKPIELNKCLADILEDEVEDKYYLSKDIQNRFKLTNQNKNVIGTTAPPFRTIGQRDLVYNKEGVMGTLVATDYKQPKQILDERPIRLGGVFDTEKSKHQAGSIWRTEGISPTLDTMQGGYRQPCIICNPKDDKELEIIKNNEYKIRKLTPRECFRLMGLNENYIDKIQEVGISNTQQYKLAGNSIVVNVLEGIFKELFL